jgi:hypothetical protein
MNEEIEDFEMDDLKWILGCAMRVLVDGSQHGSSSAPSAQRFGVPCKIILNDEIRNPNRRTRTFNNTLQILL